MSRILLLAALALTAVAGLPAAGADAPAAPKSREFLFTYAATVTGLKPGQAARVWLPVPPSNREQQVRIVSKKLPAEGKFGTESKFGNKLLHVHAQADERGSVPLAVTYRVKRWEVRGDAKSRPVTKEELEQALRPDARVPVGGRPAEQLLKGKELPHDQMRLAKELYDLVNGHMTYSKKGTGWGRGDAAWACDSRYGNCTDFHSLFISLARTEKIPSKFEIGFAIPEEGGRGDVPGYHCWAWFRPEGRGWIPVDISQANLAKSPEKTRYFFGNLTDNRVAFSTGRDLTLVPPQDGPVVNFLIYPYVEVEGRPYPSDRVRNQFRFQDVE
jgi:transglutaminase-like putative cysteine protease